MRSDTANCETMPWAWVSRPRRRAVALARALQRQGVRPYLRPAMRIASASQCDVVAGFLHNPCQFDLAVFVSEEAVRRCRAADAGRGRLPALAVGRATLAALSSLPAFAAMTDPAGDTDALLRLPYLQSNNIRGKSVAVIGGLSEDHPDSLSPRLLQGLRERGAQVTGVAVYQRVFAPPNVQTAEFVQSGKLRAAIAYSGETVLRMCEMCAPYQDALFYLPLFVIHDNIAVVAEKRGFQDVRMAPADVEKMAAVVGESVHRSKTV